MKGLLWHPAQLERFLEVLGSLKTTNQHPLPQLVGAGSGQLVIEMVCFRAKMSSVSKVSVCIGLPTRQKA